MFSLSCRIHLQSLLHFYRRCYYSSTNSNIIKFDCRNDPQLFLDYVQQQTNLGFHNLEFPLSLFRQMMNLPRRPSIINFNRLFSAMVKLKLRPRPRSHAVVISLSRELELSGFRLDLHSANIIVNCFCHLGRVDLGFSVFGKSLKLGYKSDIVLFNTLIHGLILSNQSRQCAKLLDKITVKLGIEPDHFTYGTMIKGLCSIGDNDGALCFLRQMNSCCSSCKPNRVMYTTLIDSLCKGRLLDEALRVFSDMKTAGIKPNVVTYTSLMRGMFSVGRKGDAKEVLFEMFESNIEPDVATYNMLVDMHGKEGMIDEALAIIRTMVERGVTPDLITYNGLLDGWCFCGRMDEARKVFDDEMVKNNCAPDVVTFNTLIHGYVKLKSFEKALNVLEEMLQYGITPDLYTYNTLIDCLCKSDRISMARQVFIDMHLRGPDPDIVTYHTLLNGLCKSRRLDEAVALFLLMEFDDVYPEIAIYYILLENLCEADEVKEAKCLLSNFHTRGYPQNTNLDAIFIGGLCRKGLTYKAMELLNKMEENRCFIDSVTYNTVIKGLIVKGDFRSALLYRDIMVNKGYRADEKINTISLLVKSNLETFLGSQKNDR